MGHHHDHGHCHHDDHGSTAGGQRKAIKAAFIITAAFAGVEVAGGIWTGSISLLSDSLHMFTDVTALALSYMASRLALLKPDAKRSFGYRRAEVVTALANGLLLWAVCGFMLSEAWARLSTPVEVMPVPMLVIAVIGLLVNMLSAWVLFGHKDTNINIRAAFLHVLSDMAGSVGVILAALVIHFTGYHRADTIVSFLIIALILYTSSRLIRDTFHILMEGTPHGLDIKDLEKALAGLEGVTGVHELHAWSISSDFNMLTAHLVVPRRESFDEVLCKATALAGEKFGLKHCAFQLETRPAANSSCDVCARC